MPLAVPLAKRIARLDPVGDAGMASAAPVPAAARDAAMDALDRGETHYTDRPGIVPLRERVAERLQADHGVQVDSKQGVVITCGVTEARFVAVQQLLASGAGTVVALAHPERLAGACAIRDVSLVGPDADPSSPVLVYLCEGADPAQRDAWLARAQAADWPVVAEVGPGFDGHPAAYGLHDRTVTIGDVGTPHGAEAWRIGFLAAPAATTGPLRDFKQALTICTTNVTQWGALALMEATA
ncbi:MAG: aminotransferase class I/II-fold pyridoxal phosphate-dependent enzyme [Trueperaceae bacterium]